MRVKKIILGVVIALVSIFLVASVCAFAGPRGRTLMTRIRILCQDPELKRTKTEILEPSRSEILDCKGRTIVTNKFVWDVHLDCTTLKASTHEWDSLAGDLSKDLERILGEKTASEYYELLMNGRRYGNRYLKLCEGKDYGIANDLMHAPILNMNQFVGGAIYDLREERDYPYGKLGRRALGFCENNRRVGIDGAYDAVLAGETGEVVYKRKRKDGKYYWEEKSRVEPVDGQPIKTTLDMDQLAIVDSELRSAVEGRKDIKSACAVLMEASTGAVRAMVNLTYGYYGDSFGEVYNESIGYEYEPGIILTKLPAEVLKVGLDSAKIDIEGLKDTHYKVDGRGIVNVSCSPLHVLRIYGGIANGGIMFDPYLVTPSSFRTLCTPSMADSLKCALEDGCLSTARMPLPAANGSTAYRYPSGECEYATTWAGFFNAKGIDYVLMVAAFSKPTLATAPQRNVPEKVAKGIIEKIDR